MTKGCLWASAWPMLSWDVSPVSSHWPRDQGVSGSFKLPRTEPKSKLTGPWRERGWILWS